MESKIFLCEKIRPYPGECRIFFWHCLTLKENWAQGKIQWATSFTYLLYAGFTGHIAHCLLIRYFLAPTHNPLVSVNNHLIRTVFFFNSTGSNPGSHFTLHGLQWWWWRVAERRRTCIYSFLRSKMTLYQIKHFHMWTVAAVVGLAAYRGQGNRPKDGLCSLTWWEAQAFCDLWSLLLKENRNCVRLSSNARQKQSLSNRRQPSISVFLIYTLKAYYCKYWNTIR